MASHPNGHMFFPISPASPTANCPPDSAPPSSSSLHPEIKYDVFISFRGTDTRSRFLSHLCEEFLRQKIDFFVDDKELEKGDKISFTLLDAIKKSEISLIVFSKDYASSTWCLKELEQIMQCKEIQEQIIVPIFYEVDPSTVRHQRGSFKDAFDELGKRFDEHTLQKWKNALKEACDLSAFVSSDYRTEAILVKDVVKHVSKLLKEARDPGDLDGFVGMHEKIQYLEARFCTKPEGIFIIGIWGMGGVGKTTIAENLFDRLCNKYEGSHFLNVREELRKHGSIKQLRNELFSVLLNEKVYNISMNIKGRLRRKKIFVILDDIYESDQLEVLTGGHAWFGPGSRIIMTSRDKHVFSKECDDIYEVPSLNSNQALQLLENVLGEDYLVNEEERHELLETVIEYAKGVPLVIKVLGRYLYDKDRNGWKSKLEKLKRVPDADIQEILELSYNEIKDEEHGEIFLYLACFFRREFKDQITFLLDSCGYSTIDGLGVLQDKALINIIYDKFVSMHDLIRDMGREVVRKKSLKDPGQRVHLFDVNDICKVFEKNMGTGTVESIRLNVASLKNDLNLGPQAFARMDNLKLLQFDNHQLNENKYSVWPPEEGFESLPYELRYFSWTGYPLKSFPLRCYLKNLVELRFVDSNLQKLWDGVQDLPELKVIDLSYSKELTRIPDLSKAPKLEVLNLDHCFKLRHFPLRLEMIDGSGKYDHLEILNMSCCPLFKLPDEIGFCLPSLQRLVLEASQVKTLPTSIRHLSQLRCLEVNYCSWLWNMPELPPSIEILYAHECRSLEMLHFVTSNSVPLSHQQDKVIIDLSNCENLGKSSLEATTMHFKHTTRRIIAGGGKDSYAQLYLPRSEVPECFSRYRATQDSVSVPLELPLHCKALGFIFYLVALTKRGDNWPSKIQCHIELSKVEEVKFIYQRKSWLKHVIESSDVFLWCERSLSLKIMEEVSRIKASTTADDVCPKVWFELLDADKSVARHYIKEWGVYPIFLYSESDDLTDTNRCPDIIGRDED